MRLSILNAYHYSKKSSEGQNFFFSGDLKLIVSFKNANPDYGSDYVVPQSSSTHKNTKTDNSGIVVEEDDTVSLPAAVKEKMNGYYQTVRLNDDDNRVYVLYVNECGGAPLLAKISGTNWVWIGNQSAKNAKVTIYASNDNCATWDLLCKDKPIYSNIKSTDSFYEFNLYGLSTLF